MSERAETAVGGGPVRRNGSAGSVEPAGGNEPQGLDTICQVCMHHCRLRPGQIGRCLARAGAGGNVAGEICGDGYGGVREACGDGVSGVRETTGNGYGGVREDAVSGSGRAVGTVCQNYGKITSMALDPIEKKPLGWFCSGSRILSVGSYGCNLSCPFCQNHEISAAGEGGLPYRYLSPEELAQYAKKLKKDGNIGVAFTYNEPLVGYEYVRDTARLVRDLGMKNVIVTNGSVTGPVLDEILPLTDAMNIDLKGFTQSYYEKLGGDLETVKKFIEKASGRCHVELTTLIVPGENDSPDEMDQLAAWVAGLDAQIPLHVTRFFPRFKMRDRPPTDVRAVCSLAERARKYLSRVTVGNCQ